MIRIIAILYGFWPKKESTLRYSDGVWILFGPEDDSGQFAPPIGIIIIK